MQARESSRCAPSPFAAPRSTPWPVGGQERAFAQGGAVRDARRVNRAVVIPTRAPCRDGSASGRRGRGWTGRRSTDSPVARLARRASGLGPRRSAVAGARVADHRACARGSGATRFRSTETPRDGRGVALAGDALDLMDALGLHGVPVVGHDWGARVAYTVAAVAPEREARSPRSRFPISPRCLHRPGFPATRRSVPRPAQRRACSRCNTASSRKRGSWPASRPETRPSRSSECALIKDGSNAS
jgi:hypothetical protein